MTKASEALATDAGLRYVTDDEPGIKRVRRGNGFSCFDPRGSVINGSGRERIASLAIPPAWSDVWISSDENGHILATGHDDAGRKQYIYHPRAGSKSGTASNSTGCAPSGADSPDSGGAPFGLATTRIGATPGGSPGGRGTRPDVDQSGHGPICKGERLLRLTTLTTDHVEVSGHHVRLAFAGKGGADQQLAYSDRRLASLIARCQELNGQTLFSYETEDGIDAISSTDVNEYVAACGRGGVHSQGLPDLGSECHRDGRVGDRPGGRRRDERALPVGSRRSGGMARQQPEVCRNSYVHPVVEEALSSGELTTAWRSSGRGKWLTRSESTLNRLLSSCG